MLSASLYGDGSQKHEEILGLHTCFKWLALEYMFLIEFGGVQEQEDKTAAGSKCNSSSSDCGNGNTKDSGGGTTKQDMFL